MSGISPYLDLSLCAAGLQGARPEQSPQQEGQEPLAIRVPGRPQEGKAEADERPQGPMQEPAGQPAAAATPQQTNSASLELQQEQPESGAGGVASDHMEVDAAAASADGQAAAQQSQGSPEREGEAAASAEGQAPVQQPQGSPERLAAAPGDELPQDPGGQQQQPPDGVSSGQGIAVPAAQGQPEPKHELPAEPVEDGTDLARQLLEESPAAPAQMDTGEPKCLMF